MLVYLTDISAHLVCIHADDVCVRFLAATSYHRQNASSLTTMGMISIRLINPAVAHMVFKVLHAESSHSCLMTAAIDFTNRSLTDLLDGNIPSIISTFCLPVPPETTTSSKTIRRRTNCPAGL